jgi:hypothetical protein
MAKRKKRKSTGADWEQWQDDFLAEHYKTMGNVDLADALGRSKAAVAQRLGMLDLKRPKSFPVWRTLTDCAKIIEQAGIKLHRSSLYFHVRTGSIHSVKMQIGKDEFWMVYLPSLARYMSAVKTGAVKQEVWQWNILVERGQVENPAPPTL